MSHVLVLNKQNKHSLIGFLIQDNSIGYVVLYYKGESPVRDIFLNLLRKIADV